MGFTEIFKVRHSFKQNSIIQLTRGEQILFLPAIIAAALYLLLAFVILPLVKRHRERYSQYLPLDSIQQHTNGARDRLGNFLMRLVVPRRQAVVDADDQWRSGSGEDFTFEDGERMVGFDVEAQRGGGRR